MKTILTETKDIHQALADACREAGIVPPTELPPADDKFHRADVAGAKNGRGDATIKLFRDGDGGIVCNWQSREPLAFFVKNDSALSDEERAERERRSDAARREAEAERERIAKDGAAKAFAIWSAATPADVGHPYLMGKGMKPVETLREIDVKKAKALASWAPYAKGKFLRGRLLVVPIHSADGRLMSVEFIDVVGLKSALKGAVKDGGYWSAVPLEPHHSRLIVAEGVATALSIHESTGTPTVAALTCGNLQNVAVSMRSQHPDAELIVAGDIGNGSDDARKAALAVGARLVFPDFGMQRRDDQSDFNDLMQTHGVDEVRRQIEAVTAPDAERETAPTETDDEAIARLAALPPMAYDRARKHEAAHLKVRPATLDLMVRQARGDAETNEAAPFEEIEMWPEPVDGAALLDDIADTLARFVICDGEIMAAVALWCAASWLAESVGVCPILLINAPDKSCGKTLLLSLVGRLVPRPAQAASISPSVLFRMIEKYRPTLLVDEAETVLTKDAEDLRGLFNAGHTRDSAYVWRSVPVGDDFEPRRFRVFGFKALAGINADRLAETVTSRSIIATLRRKLPGEKIERLRHAEPDLFDTLHAKLARWADDHAETARNARPELPDALGDRDQDNWEPLLTVADLAGGDWPELARTVALKLSGNGDASQSAGAELLDNIRDIFARLNVRRIAMADLLAELLIDDEAPWRTWNRGHEMTLRQLGKKLSEYGIRSQTVKIDYQSPKGFKIEQFTDAFARYLPVALTTPSPSVTGSPANTGAGFAVTGVKLRDPAKTPLVTVKPLSDGQSDQVTGGREVAGEAEEIFDRSGRHERARS
ncbi:DUF3631 domain-containing protein [Paraburkholderia nodosa]|uniref:DUF3631 domain-containing protein n=1 Tax=Paraburkholderia nodosa TaxID=392320 RepID=UPI00084156AD|nr:DUF3631 domain-containing protein [Paraburkholderia nodosa]